jgi:bifunctional DNase/RNase
MGQLDIGARYPQIGEMNDPLDPRSAVKMTIRGLVMDPTSNTPVVVLENPEGNLLLPIWIGVCEANSIALEIEGVAVPRPMTHDLIRDLLATAGCVIDHIFIHTLEDSVFKASIQLRDANAVVHSVDSRPSDAIAIALRAKVDVLVDPVVLEHGILNATTVEETIRELLEKMRPEDMGEYEM